MQIKVLVDTIEYQPVLDYYNTNKPENEEPLERLDRAEGGFKIQIPSMKNKSVDENSKIRQLRWSMGTLVSRSGWNIYIGFTEKQTMMLYEALVHALRGNVILEQ
jgi:hypothetical protein